MNSIIIRDATELDISAVLEIINYEILNSTAIWDYNARTETAQMQIYLDKKEQGFPFIVAEIDGKVAGFGTFGLFRFREAYKTTVEHSVYVANEFQGKKVGKLLLEELIVIAKKQKIHTMIGVIDSENKKSIAFHEKFGFEIAGNLKETGFKFGRWMDSVFMQKVL